MKVLFRSTFSLVMVLGLTACDGLDLGTGGDEEEITTQITTNDLAGVRIRFYRQNAGAGQQPWWEYFFTGSQMQACNQDRTLNNPFVANSYRASGGNTIEVFFGPGTYEGPSERYALTFLNGSKSGPILMSGRFNLSSFYANGSPIPVGTASGEEWEQVATSESWC